MFNKQQLLDDFINFHDQSQSLWDEVMQTGDASSLETAFLDSTKTFFFSKGQENPAIYNTDEMISGMRQSIEALKGGTKRFENKVIRLRGDDEAVVFFEQIIEMNGNEVARLFTIENWRLVDGKWYIIREIVEPA